MAATSLLTVYTSSTLPFLTSTFSKPRFSIAPLSSQTKKRCRITSSLTENREAVPVSEDRRALFHKHEGSSSLPSKADTTGVARDSDLLTSRAINAAIVLGFGAFAVTKFLTIDRDYLSQ